MKEVENIIDEKKQGEAASPAKKVTTILSTFADDSKDLSEAKSLAVDYEQLYSDAKKENASLEEKKKFAVNAVLMQNAMKRHLTQVGKNHPDQFRHDPKSIDLYTAYAVNSYATVDALQSVGGEVFGPLIKQAYEEASGHKELKEENKGAFQNDMAKLLYLSFLQYEYDHVTGTKEEQDSWRAEILTELISDQFEENVERFKENLFYREVMKEYDRVYEEAQKGNLRESPSVDEIITQAFHNRADERYQRVFPAVHNGIPSVVGMTDEETKTNNDNRAAIAATAHEIDLMKSIYYNISMGAHNEVSEDFSNDPVFDTLYMKRRAGNEDVVFNSPREFGKQKEKEKAVDYLAELIEIPKKKEQFKKIADEMGDGNGEKIYQTQNAALMKRENELKNKFYKQGFSYDDVDWMIKGADSQIKEYREQCKKSNQSVKRKDIYDIQKKVIEDYYKNLFMHEQRDKKDVVEEGKHYEHMREIREEEGAKRELDRIKEKRYEMSRGYKRKNPVFYKHAAYKNRDVLISKSTDEVKKSLEDDFAKYVNEYRDKSPETKRKFEKSIQNFEKADAKHYEEEAFPRPDRSSFRIPEFKIESAPDLVIDAPDMAKLAIDPTLVRPVDAPEEVPVVPGPDPDPVTWIQSAYEEVKNHSFTFFSGSPEYKAIYDGLKELSRQNPPVIDGEQAVTETLPKYMRLQAIMERYIERKTDEKEDREKEHLVEKSNSAKRRAAMKQAKMYLDLAIFNIRERNKNIVPEDSTMDMVQSRIAYEVEYNKNTDENVRNILTALQNKDRQEAQEAMGNYLKINVDLYRENDKYAFRVDLDQDNGKRRIPKTDRDERMYATILRQYITLTNSNLEYYRTNAISQLPDQLLKLRHFEDGPGVVRHVNRVIGTKFRLSEVKPDFSLKKTDNVVDYIGQFSDYCQYCNKTFANKVYDNLAKGEKDFTHNAFDDENMKVLVDSTFSALYLDAETKNQPGKLSFDELDENRRKILTVIHKTSIPEKIKESLTEHYKSNVLPHITVNLQNGVIRNDESVRNVAKNHVRGKKNEIINYSDFGSVIINKAVVASLKDSIEKVNRLLEKPAENKQKLKSAMESLSTTAMIVKGVGLPDALNKANEDWKIDNKGKTFDETLKNLEQGLKAKLGRKLEAPAKRVTVK